MSRSSWNVNRKDRRLEFVAHSALPCFSAMTAQKALRYVLCYPLRGFGQLVVVVVLPSPRRQREYQSAPEALPL